MTLEVAFERAANVTLGRVPLRWLMYDFGNCL